MVDPQPTTSGTDGCPEMLACQTLAHRPVLVQQRDLTLCCHQTQKMHPACRQRHLARQHSHFRRTQAPPTDRLVCLIWCCSLQRWWMVALGIKPHELWRCPSHCCQSIEAMRAPERLAPQFVQSLDNTVALGFADWQEDRLDAKVQTQAHKRAKHPPDFVATVEGCVVVELQPIR